MKLSDYVVDVITDAVIIMAGSSYSNEIVNNLKNNYKPGLLISVLSDNCLHVAK